MTNAPAPSPLHRMRAERRHQIANAAAVIRIVADALRRDGIEQITPDGLDRLAQQMEGTT